MPIGNRWMVFVNASSGNLANAGLPSHMMPPGTWRTAMSDFWLPKFDSFNDDDLANAMLHMPFGCDTAGGDYPFDAYILRRLSAAPQFASVKNLDDFAYAMQLYYQQTGKPMHLYFGTIEGSQRTKWRNYKFSGFYNRLKAALQPLLVLPKELRCLVIDTMGVAETRLYYSGVTPLESRMGMLYEMCCDILEVRTVSIEPRGAIGTPYTDYPECKHIVTSQLHRHTNETGSGTGGGWCVPKAQLAGELIIFDNGNPEQELPNTFEEVTTWLSQGYSYMMGGNSYQIGTDWTSAELAAGAALIS